MKKSAFKAMACILASATLISSCQKSGLDELTSENLADANVSKTSVHESNGLYVSAADTAAATKNLFLYITSPDYMVDSASYRTEAKDGNGVFYYSAKKELYQLSRAKKTIYVFDDAAALAENPIPARTITDNTLSSGREITYDKQRDILYVANNSDSTIRVYKNFSYRSGNVTGKVLKISGQPWGIFYDDISNSLIVLIDQAAMRLDIFDNPASLSGTVTASRSLNITNRPNGTFSRLHGLTFDAMADVLLVTEIGEATAPVTPTDGKPAFNADGGIYVIKNAASKLASGGNVAADAVIYGSNTMLGNPVDIAFGKVNGFNAMFVAEKANKKILAFRLNDSGNIAPYSAVNTSISPEALTVKY